MISQQTFGIVAAVFGICAYIPYIRAVIKGRTRPHVFSWFLWCLMSAIVFFAQVSAGAGAGAWVTASIAVLCAVIFALALRQGETSITLSDRISLIAALAAIPLWLLTKDPLWSVILLCVIYVLAFYPTIRKSWLRPHQETILSFALGTVRSVLNLLALQTVNLTTSLYPLVNLLTCVLFVVLVLWRRKVHPLQSNSP